MTAQKTAEAQAAEEQAAADQLAADQLAELKGRLVLVTGEVVPVPVEGLSVATDHYSEQYKATVKVASTFVVD